MLSEFAAEQWMTRYETLAKVNMTETSCDALRSEERRVGKECGS